MTDEEFFKSITTPTLVVKPEGATMVNPEDAAILNEINGKDKRDKATKYLGEDPEKSGVLWRTLAGAKHRFDDMAYGLEDLITGSVSPEHQQQLEEGKAATELSGTAAKVGGIIPDVVTGMATGGSTGVLTGGAKLLPRILAQMGAGAAEGYILNSDENRKGGAIGGGLGAGAGEVLGSLGTRFVKGLVPPSDEARRLMEQGIIPSIGQAADRSTLAGKTASTIEQGADFIPGVNAITGRARDRALTPIREELMRYGMPGGAALPEGKSGQEAFKIMEDVVGKNYDDILSRPVDKNLIDSLTKRLIGTTAMDDTVRASARARNEFGNIAGTHIGDINTVGKPTLQDLKGGRADIFTHSGTSADPGVPRVAGKAWDEIGSVIRRNVPQPQRQLYDQTDEAYKAQQILRDAVLKEPKSGNFNPDDYLASIKKNNPEAFARGEGFNQPFAQDASKVMDLPSEGRLLYSGVRDAMHHPALGMAAVGGSAALAGVPITGGILGALMAAESKAGVRGLTGMTQTQQALLPYLMKSPHLMTSLGQIIGEELGTE